MSISILRAVKADGQGSKQDLRNNVGWDTHLRLSESNDLTIQPSGRTHFKPSESYARKVSDQSS
jgi:hypothetical protein